jgi:hypothetical protein
MRFADQPLGKGSPETKRQDKPGLLVAIASKLAATAPEFHENLGPGAGDRRTHAFMRSLGELAAAKFGADYSEKKLCGKTSLAVDFYFPKERTIVEVALGLPNSATEFEKDVLKAIMAGETGQSVKRLVLLSRAGGIKKCSQPGRRSVIDWARRMHSLTIEIYDLPGEARKRARRARRPVEHSSASHNTHRRPGKRNTAGN